MAENQNSLTPEERKKIYDEEKARIEARDEIERGRNRPAEPIKANPKVGCIAIIIVLVVLVVCVNLLRSPTGPTDESTASYDEPSMKRIGDIAYLQLKDGQDDVWVSEDEQTYKELIDAVMAQDNIGIKKLVLYSGRVFTVDSGTKVLVLESGLERAKVRILEGDNYGKSGWVIRQAVQ